MADRRISDFPVLAEAKDDDLILISSESESYGMKVGTFKKAVGYQIAEEAKTAAEKANTTAEKANTTAEEANTTAEEANTTAEEAKTAAEKANTTAEKANTTAEEANTTAEEANTNAEEAKTTAEKANTTAEKANTTAEKANTTAEEANTIAEEANTNSEEAKTTAEKALAIFAIQPDYAENDVASPGHVLNREFYRERIYDGLLTIPEYTGEEVCTNSVNGVKFIKIADLKHNHRTIIEQLSVIKYTDGSEKDKFARTFYNNHSRLYSGDIIKVVATTVATSVSYTINQTIVYEFNFPEPGLYVEYQSGNAISKISNILFDDYIKTLDSRFLSFEKIDFPDDFEGYTDVIHLSEPVVKDWSKVKIWSADDGLVLPESTSPYDFDYSLITETNHAEIGTLPSLLDLSTLPEKTAGASIILMDESRSFFCVIQFLKTEGTYVCPVTLSSTRMEKASHLEYLRVGDTTPSIDFTATEEGWYVVNLNDRTALPATEEDLSLFSGTYENLKILDWGSLNIDAIKELGVSAPSTEELLELFVKDFISFVYPPGYYLTEESKEYATKDDIAEINERLDTLVPKTWAEVQQVVRSGRASQVFNIGDQLICSKDGTAHVWDVIGFDFDTPINPNYTHSITLQLNTAFEYRAFDDDSNNYSVSTVREYLNGDYLTGFDEDFLSVIGGTCKSDLLYNTDEESTEDDIYPESEVFFLLSADEVSTSPYEYYSSAETDPTIRIKTAGNTALCQWWLRSNSQSGTSSAAADKVGTDGDVGAGTITRASYYLAPACIIY